MSADKEQKRIRLLLADDHAVVRAGTRELLERKADLHIVGEASDGEEAVRLTHELKPDVVVMDVRMPKMDGLTMLRELRASEITATTPVVMLSASIRDQHQALEAGANFFISKPYEAESVLSALDLSMQEETVS